MAVHCAVPATDNGRGTQMPYIRDLLQQRSIPGEPRPDHLNGDSLMLERFMDVLGGKALCKHEASEFIDWLVKLDMKDGSPPPVPRPRPTAGQLRYARSKWTAPQATPTQRSHKDIATEAIAVARQLAAQPGARVRMQLVGQLAALEAELLK